MLPNEAPPWLLQTGSLAGAARHGQEMPPVEPAGSCDVGKSIQRKFGKGGGLGQCIRKLPAKFVLELLERSLAEARAKGGGQLRERHDRVVGSEHATEVELKDVREGDSFAEGDDAGDFVVVTLVSRYDSYDMSSAAASSPGSFPVASRAACMASAYPASPCPMLVIVPRRASRGASSSSQHRPDSAGSTAQRLMSRNWSDSRQRDLGAALWVTGNFLW